MGSFVSNKLKEDLTECLSDKIMPFQKCRLHQSIHSHTSPSTSSP